MSYTIVLFYKYTRIDDPEGLRNTQFTLLTHLGMKGRGIIAHEGINGTFEGTTENVEKYIAEMEKDSRFSDIHWKKSTGTGNAFPKLRVRARDEIVSLHLGDPEGKSTSYGAGETDIDPNILTGERLKPEELEKWYEEGREFYIIDMRNDYELKVGKFENTIFPGMENFRDLREKVEEIKNLKDKTVLTVCTGGVRCEKASGYLKREGFKDVYQLDGGIVSYMEKYPSKNFKGSLYVFDNRITMHFDKPEEHTVIGICERCNEKSEHYVNCANMECHDHLIVCEICSAKTGGKAYCSEHCEQIGFENNEKVLHSSYGVTTKASV